MKRIKRSNFINAFNQVKHSRKLSTAKVARNSSLSRSYVYHVVSPRYKMDITPATARKVGKGLGLNQSQIEKWLHSMESSQKSKPVKKYAAHHSPIHHKNKTSANQQLQHSKPITEYQKKLIQTVRDLMSAKGISTQKLAERSGLNEQRVSDYIHGKVSSISRLTIVRLSRGLDVIPTKLLNLNHSQSKANSVHHDFKNEQLVNKAKNYISKPQLALNHQQPMRRSVKQIIKDINKLNDADIAIVDLIVNRISEAEHHDKK